VVWLPRIFRGFRFDIEVYKAFAKLASEEGYTATGALEQFMRICVDEGALVFPEKRIEGLEVEAKVLSDWLLKGKRFYRKEEGEEINISGRLLWLLPKVRGAELRGQIEQALRQPVPIKRCPSFFGCRF